ncbi:MAG: hypothetical protein J0L75_15415 [Spirochaetes bacterium]|nr:hypothetical protein [Spirochaetota bacterium]
MHHSTYARAALVAGVFVLLLAASALLQWSRTPLLHPEGAAYASAYLREEPRWVGGLVRKVFDAHANDLSHYFRAREASYALDMVDAFLLLASHRAGWVHTHSLLHWILASLLALCFFWLGLRSGTRWGPWLGLALAVWFLTLPPVVFQFWFRTAKIATGVVGAGCLLAWWLARSQREPASPRWGWAWLAPALLLLFLDEMGFWFAGVLGALFLLTWRLEGRSRFLRNATLAWAAAGAVKLFYMAWAGPALIFLTQHYHPARVKRAHLELFWREPLGMLDKGFESFFAVLREGTGGSTSLAILFLLFLGAGGLALARRLSRERGAGFAGYATGYFAVLLSCPIMMALIAADGAGTANDMVFWSGVMNLVYYSVPAWGIVAALAFISVIELGTRLPRGRWVLAGFLCVLAIFNLGRIPASQKTLRGHPMLREAYEMTPLIYDAITRGVPVDETKVPPSTDYFPYELFKPHYQAFIRRMAP